jgi:hypothetical protein
MSFLNIFGWDERVFISPSAKSAQFGFFKALGGYETLRISHGATAIGEHVLKMFNYVGNRSYEEFSASEYYFMRMPPLHKLLKIRKTEFEERIKNLMIKSDGTEVSVIPAFLVGSGRSAYWQGYDSKAIVVPADASEAIGSAILCLLASEPDPVSRTLT